MRRLVWIPALAGMLIATAPAWGQGIVRVQPYRTACPAPGQAAGCCHHHHHHQPACGHGHCGSWPCAQFFKDDTNPLPYITLSRYVEKGEYDCVKRLYGDGYPYCPGYWFQGQPYPMPHDYASGGAGSSTAGGPSGGRGIGVGGGGGSNFRGAEPSGPTGGRGIGVGGTGPNFRDMEPSGPTGGRGIGIGGR